MFGGLFASFDKAKTKAQLKLTIQRISLMRNKRYQQIEVVKKQVAQFLQTGKEEQARVKVEHVIRETSLAEGFDILASLCDLLLARFALVESEKTCASDIKEIVCTLFWAAPRCEIKELQVVKEQLLMRYGKPLAEEFKEMQTDLCDARVVYKLSYRRPTDSEIRQCLTRCAKENGFEWIDEVHSQIDGYDAPSGAVPEVPNISEFNQALDPAPSAPAPPFEHTVPAAVPTPQAGTVDGYTARDVPGGQGSDDDDDGPGGGVPGKPQVPPPPPPQFEDHPGAASAPPLPPTVGDAPEGGVTAEDPPDNDELERRFAALTGGAKF
mmetsp:Transcript_20554/g.32141  ORF Transcript_20554/g.32141 Transcript_20554/m.32141 type:complete len:324 (-) Transcript_20554:482-1453(-)|eukprot:CAMPEP_0184303252 /NCGR_PEP_ID=MMETSP1049-20130417/13038_1 /TAXON_ID=77928 /ORGANISM="Proteomonas sulcata, Strain CCMP704" /LENGTH=323 /DNA_ID=CAMNT_0026614741 /DNA_START=307 /DNA_END=1278 /DNA_ORIENTATION=+